MYTSFDVFFLAICSLPHFQDLPAVDFYFWKGGKKNISIVRVMAGDLSYCKSWPVQHWRDDWQGAHGPECFRVISPFFRLEIALLYGRLMKKCGLYVPSTTKTPKCDHGFMDHGVLLNIPRCRVIVVLAQLWRAPMPPSSVDTVTLQGSLWPSKGLPPTVEELW